MRKAYELLKRGPVDPRSIYGSASGSATTNSKSEEDDEEQTKKLKALALFRAQQKSRQIDPPFSMVQKEYEAVINQVFSTRAPSTEGNPGQWTREPGSSSGVPHDESETGYSTSTKKPSTQGYVSQRGPDTSSRYSTRDQPVNNFNQNNQSSIARGPGASRGAAPKGSAQSGIYPQPTRMTTAQVPGSQPKGDTFNAPYRHETPDG